MIDPDRLAAFALVTAVTSLMPGASMVYVMGQAMRFGVRSGLAALLGMQIGYLVWWLLAALGLGTLAVAYPFVFRLLAAGGALYLAWLGMGAIRHSLLANAELPVPAHIPSTTGFRDGIIVALGNPKSLIYMVAILPPFIDTQQEVAAQIVVLALVGLVIDVAIGSLYIAAGKGLTAAMTRPTTRVWLDRGVGSIYLVIAAAIVLTL